ncbi:MAG: transporter substrate-binding domain-containing protein [Eubacteriales bacterium]|nr:transporter substrate-binding domain-containing protein [Eubacteriales bacterium]
MIKKHFVNFILLVLCFVLSFETAVFAAASGSTESSAQPTSQAVTETDPATRVTPDRGDNTSHELIRVGFFAMDGYHMHDAEGNRSGYGYEFLRKMARYIDVDYEYVGYNKSWEEMLTMLENGEIDLLTSARKTPEREKKFDFSKSIGTSCAVLTIRDDNTKIIPQNYKTYDGMRVAIMAGNSRNEEFATFAEDNGFTYTPVYYATADEMDEALMAGEVDAIVTSSLRNSAGERIIENFNYSDFYAIVKKGNTELLEKINYAIDQMNSIDINWKNNLFSKFYEESGDRLIYFSESEHALIEEIRNSGKPLRVLSDPTCFPYSYLEDGVFRGIVPEYFEKLAEYIGISYEFVPCETRDQFLELQSDQTIDLCLNTIASSEAYAEEHNLTLTVPYLKLHVAELTRYDFDGNITTVATVRQGFGPSIAEKNAPDAIVLFFASREEAMESVLRGKSDIAYVYQYSAQEFVNRDHSGALTYRVLDDPIYEYRIAVSPHVSHILAGIFTKAIYALPDEVIQRIIVSHISYKATQLSAVDFIKVYPVQATVIVVFIMLMISAAAMFYARMRHRIRMQEAELKRADEMKELKEKAEAASRAKSAFLFNMSHDIRTPMNAIIGYSQLVKKELTDPKLINYHEKIEDSSNLLLSIINNTLDMSRIESGQVELNETVVDTQTVMGEVMSIIEELAKDKDLHIESEWDLSFRYVIADETKIKEIFLNLLSNAVKYTPEGGSVRLIASEVPCKREGYVCVQSIIEDTGIGMSAEYLPRLFESFSRERNTTTGKVAGTGLGMPIVKRLIELMGGTIEVESEVGKGTKFTFTLEHRLADSKDIEAMEKDRAEADTKINASGTEATDSNSNEEEASAREPGATDTVMAAPSDSDLLRGRRILLAEDNELNAEIAIIILEEMGIKVDHATNGKGAVKRYEIEPAGTYDLILMDIQMPEMNGYEATRAIRALKDEKKAGIPIIAMTANAFKEDMENAFAAGMNGHVAKPIDVMRLREAILEALKQKGGN